MDGRERQPPRGGGGGGFGTEEIERGVGETTYTPVHELHRVENLVMLAAQQVITLLGVVVFRVVAVKLGFVRPVAVAPDLAAHFPLRMGDERGETPVGLKYLDIPVGVDVV